MPKKEYKYFPWISAAFTLARKYQKQGSSLLCKNTLAHLLWIDQSAEYGRTQQDLKYAKVILSCETYGKKGKNCIYICHSF